MDNNWNRLVHSLDWTESFPIKNLRNLWVKLKVEIWYIVLGSTFGIIQFWSWSSILAIWYSWLTIFEIVRFSPLLCSFELLRMNSYKDVILGDSCTHNLLRSHTYSHSIVFSYLTFSTKFNKFKVKKKKKSKIKRNLR